MSYDCFQYYLTPYPDQKHPWLIRPTGNRPNPKSLGRGVVRGSPSPSPFADFLGVFITPLGWCLLVGVSIWINSKIYLQCNAWIQQKKLGWFAMVGICCCFVVLFFCLWLCFCLFVCLFVSLFVSLIMWFCLFGAMVGFLPIQGPCWCLSFSLLESSWKQQISTCASDKSQFLHVCRDACKSEL